jgi:homoserine dehydrogenase
MEIALAHPKIHANFTRYNVHPYSLEEMMIMKTIRIALIGFGNVGQGLMQILRDREQEISRDSQMKIIPVAVSDLLLGSLCNPEGLSPIALLEAMRTDGNLKGLPAPFTGWDSLKTIRETNADVVVELSPTNLLSGEPAISHIQAAFESGKHAVTTNKGPIALRFRELQAMATAHGVQLGIEGTVMSGTPSLRMGTELLAGAGIRRIQGIINGTTNYILTQMKAGQEYAAALAEAQAKGYAEADPSGDVDGHDAAGKLVILANLLMGAPIGLAQVDRTGISKLTAADIRAAAQAGETWKLIASVERKADGGVTARVAPQRLPNDHPLAAVKGATNAITFTTDLLGDITLIGPGAGRLETGYAILCDLFAIYRGK